MGKAHQGPHRWLDEVAGLEVRGAVAARQQARPLVHARLDVRPDALVLRLADLSRAVPQAGKSDPRLAAAERHSACTCILVVQAAGPEG